MTHYAVFVLCSRLLTHPRPPPPLFVVPFSSLSGRPDARVQAAGNRCCTRVLEGVLEPLQHQHCLTLTLTLTEPSSPSFQKAVVLAVAFSAAIVVIILIFACTCGGVASKQKKTEQEEKLWNCSK